MLSVPRSPDPHRLLLRALFVAFPDVALLCSAMTPWASATFVGARHMLTLRCPSTADAQAVQAALPELDFALRGQLVADIVGTIDPEAPTLVAIEALTVEER